MAGADSLIGQTVSHYRILEKLRGGGMGVVQKADDVTRLYLWVPAAILGLLGVCVVATIVVTRGTDKAAV